MLMIKCKIQDLIIFPQEATLKKLKQTKGYTITIDQNNRNKPQLSTNKRKQSEYSCWSLLKLNAAFFSGCRYLPIYLSTHFANYSQEPSPEKDEEYVTKINEYINNPPQPSSPQGNSCSVVFVIALFLYMHPTSLH